MQRVSDAVLQAGCKDDWRPLAPKCMCTATVWTCQKEQICHYTQVNLHKTSDALHMAEKSL
ncbi:hypothetical protein EXN66_Car020457 [Channa argus]|uniref:Uncharacterized protein n=1 Tax=Channa argus TaxID=215402 RepID=A0A6G1QQM4_CHAAH|nr:hypothetical protein EXN66_Car020457 [Channa argus]